MHPAPSIIAFTTLSGLGFGLIAWLGLGLAPALPPVLAAALALGLASAGLLASLLHLGQPTRFLKAFTQWRTSWLSREAVLAVATLATFGLYAVLWAWAGFRTPVLGFPTAALALATVGATAMIYAQMRSVPRWRSPLTPVLFLLFALAGGALLAPVPSAAPWLLAALGIAQVAGWLDGDRRFAASGSTLATATGLGALGRLRLLEPPHTGRNYLLREMVHVVGRRHARRLRLFGLLFAVVLPLAARHPRAAFRDRRARRPRSPTSPARWCCAGCSSRRPSTRLDSTTESAKRVARPSREEASRLAEGQQVQARNRRDRRARDGAAAAGGGALLAEIAQGPAHPADHQPRHRTLGHSQGMADATTAATPRPRRARPSRRPACAASSPSAASASTPTRRRSRRSARCSSPCGSSRSRCAKWCASTPRPASAGSSGSVRRPPPSRVTEPELKALIRGFDAVPAARRHCGGADRRLGLGQRAREERRPWTSTG